MTPKKAPEKKGKVAVKPVPKARLKKQIPVRRRKSLAQVRSNLDTAKGWYIRGVVPADGDRAEVRSPSLEDVAVLAGLMVNTVHKRSARDGWKALRDEARAKDAVEQLRVEAETRKALMAQNNRLVQQLGDNHAKARTQAFSRAVNLGRTIDTILAEQVIDVDRVVALSLASGRVQEQVDIAVVGPKALLARDLQGATVNNTVISVGWATVAAPPSPRLVEQLREVEALEAQ